MISIEVKENEAIERAIRRFKKKILQSRIINEYRRRRYFLKPSKIKREAKKIGYIRQRIEQRAHKYY